MASGPCKVNMQFLLHEGHNSGCSDGWGLYAMDALMGALMGGVFTPCLILLSTLAFLTSLSPKTWQMLGSQHPFYGTSPLLCY